MAFSCAYSKADAWSWVFFARRFCVFLCGGSYSLFESLFGLIFHCASSAMVDDLLVIKWATKLLK